MLRYVPVGQVILALASPHYPSFHEQCIFMYLCLSLSHKYSFC